MSAWPVILIGAAMIWLAFAVLFKLASWVRLPVASALALGLAGYSWQGQPDLRGAPAIRTINMEGFGEVIDAPLNGLTNRYGAAARWIALSEAMRRQGKLSDAARILYGGTINYPDNADMWVAYGDALAASSNGIINPAAELAFERAAVLNPQHPGPQLFLGLAAAQQDDFAKARAIWEALLARSPQQAPYRADLESRLKMMATLESGMVQSTAGRPVD